MIVWYIIFGILAGIFGGMGMGGGTVLVPMFTIFLNYSQIESQGINLICFFFLALSSLILHLKNKMIEKRFLLLIILFSLPFSALGAFASNHINNQILKVFFGIFLMILAIFEFIKLFRKKSI